MVRKNMLLAIYIGIQGILLSVFVSFGSSDEGLSRRYRLDEKNYWISSAKDVSSWEKPLPNIVPLSLDEQNARASAKQRMTEQRHSKTDGAENKISKDSSSKVSTGKKEKSQERSLEAKFSALRQSALDVVSIVWDLMQRDELHLGWITKLFSSQNSVHRGGNLFSKFLEKQKSMPYSGGTSRAGEEMMEDRGVIDWLARLIGVQGKTLGEFLREYQVHVLYDLVFTFFKWIFFLYAGLVIP